MSSLPKQGEVQKRGKQYIHVKRGSAQAKFWLNIESLGVEQAYVRHMTQQEQRQVQQIISAHFEELLDAWQEFERRK